MSNQELTFNKYPAVIGSKVEFKLEIESGFLHGTGIIIGEDSEDEKLFRIQIDNSTYFLLSNTQEQNYNSFADKYKISYKNLSYPKDSKSLLRIPYTDNEAKIHIYNMLENGCDVGNDPGFEEYWDKFPIWEKKLKDDRNKKDFNEFRDENLKSFIIPVLSNYAVSYAGSEPEKFNVPSMVKFGFQIAEEAIKQLYVKLGNELPTEEDSNGN